MSHGRKNSMRDKVIGKKWIYLERYVFHRQNEVWGARGLGEKDIPQTECGPSQKARGPEIWSV